MNLSPRGRAGARCQGFKGSRGHRAPAPKGLTFTDLSEQRGGVGLSLRHQPQKDRAGQNFIMAFYHNQICMLTGYHFHGSVSSPKLPNSSRREVEFPSKSTHSFHKSEDASYGPEAVLDTAAVTKQSVL